MTDPPEPRIQELLGACIISVGLGLFIASNGLHGGFDPIVDSISEELGGRLPREADRLVNTFLAIFGGTLVGEATAAAFLARACHGPAASWTWRALLYGHALICAGLAAVCIHAGAVSTLAVISLPLLAFFGVIALARPGTVHEPQPPSERWRVTKVFSLAQIAFGLSLFLIAPTPAFALYREWMWTALWPAGGQHPLAPAHLSFYFGMVGVFFAAHFFYLHAWLKHGADRPELARVFWVSIAAWFLVDSSGCALQGAWFNILSINVMCILGAVACWEWDRRGDSPNQAR